jgi:hypothetical protein
VPPQLLGPAPGQEVTSQPTFRWTAAEGALEYRLQVAADPTFGNPIDDVTTTSTSYTSRNTYAADTVLYWRVRANDENPTLTQRGLTWSRTGFFVRRLRFPSPLSDNPLSGETIPLLSWSPVEGAVSYDMHVEQADGTKRDFTIRSTATTPVVFYGTGVWRWQVRANFRSGLRTVSSGYSPATPFTRHIATPSGLLTTKSGSGALLQWNPAPMAHQYRVQISTSDSFSRIVEQATTDNPNYAPRMNDASFSSGVPLWWRVAVLDEGLAMGGWATSPLVKPKPMRVRVSGRLRVGRSARVRVTVTDGGGRRLGGVRVSVEGAPLIRPRSTSRRGTASFRVKAPRRGTVTFRAQKRGYATTAVQLRVR